MGRAAKWLLVLIVVALLILAAFPDLRAKLKDFLDRVLNVLAEVPGELARRLWDALTDLSYGLGFGVGVGSGTGENDGRGSTPDDSGHLDDGGRGGASQNFCTGHGGFAWVLVGPRGATRTDQLVWIPANSWDPAVYPGHYDTICSDGFQYTTRKYASGEPDPCGRAGKGQAVKALGGNPTRYQCADGSILTN